MVQRSHLVLGAAFVLTLAASVFDLPWQHGGDADGQGTAAATDAAERRAARSAAGNSAAAQAPTSGAASRPLHGLSAAAGHAVNSDASGTQPGTARMHHSKANAFATHSWLPPVPKAKPAPPPPPPRAPPLPFAYLGKMQDGAAVTAFVSQGGRNHVLHSGDTLPQYKVESISPTEITFVYLPLGEKQRLTFGSEN